MRAADYCNACVHKNSAKSVECGSCMAEYFDGTLTKAPSNYKAKPQTNADRIRAMSDEGLAAFLTFGCPCPANNCRPSCESCITEWLKQPAEVE